MAKIESDKPLPKHTRLKYEECYAKVILEDLFPDEYKELRIEDKPDLINEATSVGIEVTSAISENHREAINLWAGMPYASPEKQEQNKERMQKLGVEYQGGIQGWPSEECPFEEIINAFDKKIEKLNSGQYRQMQRYDLFINSEAWLINKEAEKMLQTLVEKNTGSLIYTFVFLTTTMDIYRFDLLRGQFIEIPYNLYHNRQFDWPMKARQMVEDGEPK